MKPQNENDLIQVAEAIYREQNPNGKMNVPTSAYLITEKWANEWMKKVSHESLYNWININKK